METRKEFDCLEFKRQAQAKFAEKYAGLSPEDTAKQVHDWVEHSEDPMARWWRSIRANRVAEDAEEY